MLPLESDTNIIAKRIRVETLTALAFSLSLILLSGSAPAESAAPRSNPRIVNGLPTTSFPTTGALLESESQICSGTLIGCETFLTAAHCVEFSYPDELEVFFQHAGLFQVSSISIHPSFDFPVADVAVLKLAQPVTGILPTPINQTSPAGFIPHSGTIVGFGLSDGNQNDAGIKRQGQIETTSCLPSSGATDTELVCWNFSAPVGSPGTDSNTCFGDSGGPLFMDLGNGTVVAGITSGGTNGECLTTDHSYDANVENYKDFILAQGGADVTHPTCVGPFVESPDVDVLAANGTIDFNGPFEARTQFSIPSGASQLRVVLNAADNGSIFDMYLKHGSAPTLEDYHCQSMTDAQFKACILDAPAGGEWHVLIDAFVGYGDYQLTRTVFGADGSDPAVCGNGVVELGEQCDGAGNQCLGACKSDCTCQTELDEFACYKTRRSAFGERFERTEVLLSDGFESGPFEARSQKHLCVASDTDVDADGIQDPNTHLVSYVLRSAGGATHDRRKGLAISDKYGDHTMDTLRVTRLMVPTSLSLVSPPGPLDPDNHIVDHYKCYQAKKSRGTPSFPRGVETFVTNSLEALLGGRKFGLRSPKEICLPVDQDGQGIKDANQGLTCYTAKRARKQPKHIKHGALHLENEFGIQRLDTVKADLLCAAAEISAPSPDDCSNAAAIPGFPATLQVNTANNTVSADDPFVECGTGDQQAHSTWFEFVAPEAGIVTISTLNSNYDTVLSAHSGVCGDLSPLTCNDDVDGTLQSRIQLSVLAGETYRVEVTSYGDDSGGNLVLNIDLETCDENCTGPVANQCIDAGAISEFPTVIQQDLSTFSTNPDEPTLTCADAGRSGWVRVTAPDDGFVTASTEGSAYDTVLAAHSGTCGSLSELACNDQFVGDQSQIRFPVSAGEDYLVEIAAWSTGLAGQLELDLAFDQCGNNVRNPGELCDGTDAAACPGACDLACSCGSSDNAAFVFPNGIPALISPGGAMRVEVTDLLGSIQPGTGILHVEGTDGVFGEYPMTQISPNLYDAVLPLTDCGSQVRFFISAETTEGELLTTPFGAPEATHDVITADAISERFSDDFESDRGWTVSGDAQTGAWERAVPAQGGVRNDPATDADGSGQCFITGNGVDEDVDLGSTTLTSPELDVSGASGAVFFQYSRWFNDAGSNERDEPMHVEISGDAGSTWVLAEVVGPALGAGWNQAQVRVQDFTPLSDSVQIRFTVSDLPNTTVMEAGVDAVSLMEYTCN